MASAVCFVGMLICFKQENTWLPRLRPRDLWAFALTSDPGRKQPAISQAKPIHTVRHKNYSKFAHLKQEKVREGRVEMSHPNRTHQCGAFNRAYLFIMKA